jgi:sulfur relay protein TusB/DsrH
MLVLIKSSPDTAEGRRGIKLATDLGADMVLLQNGIYLAKHEILKNFNKSIYFLDEDMRLRGINFDGIDINAKVIDYDGLIRLMIGHEKVIGLF